MITLFLAGSSPSTCVRRARELQISDTSPFVHRRQRSHAPPVLCGTNEAEQRMEDLLLRSLHLQDVWERLSASVPSFEAVNGCVEVAPSSKHGLGLFARTPIDEHALVSFYPIHAIGSGSSLGDPCVTSGEDNLQYFGADAASAPYRATPTHSSLKGAWADNLWIDANPTTPDVPGWLAHRANDAAAIIDDPGSATGATSEDSILAYYAECCASRNAVLVPFGAAAPVMCLWSTRSIAPGEEILQTYGHDYWLTRQGLEVPAMSKAVAVEMRTCWKDTARLAVDVQLPERMADEMALLEGIMGS
jgi:hypothetical protein